MNEILIFRENSKKSVKKAIQFYEKDLKKHRYTYHGFAGYEPEKCCGQISKCVADVSENGICEDITIYTVGAAMKADHYYGGGVDITEPIIDFLRDRLTYSEMIDEICLQIVAFIES